MDQISHGIDDLMTVPMEPDWVARLLLSKNALEGSVTAIYGANFEFRALREIQERRDNHVHIKYLIDTPSDLWGSDVKFPLADSNATTISWDRVASFTGLMCLKIAGSVMWHLIR